MRGAAKGIALRGWTADFAVVTAMGVLLGLLGPFGSFLNGPVWQRILYWVVMAWLGFPAYAAVRLILARASSRPAAWTALIATGALFSLFSAWASWTVAHAMWPALGRVPWLTPAVWYGEGLIVSGVFALILRRRRSAAVRPNALVPAPGLLGAPSAEVLCLQMEDHYVRVHTAGGSRLVLATLSQAIAALGPTPGLRVHRSWWVAERAVRDAVADGRNLRLILVNGVSAPVARSSVAAVREAGWLGSLAAAAHPSAKRKRRALLRRQGHGDAGGSDLGPVRLVPLK